MEDEPAPDEPQVSDVDDDDLEQDEWEDDDFFVHDEEPLERPLADVLKDLPTSPEASSADSESEADAESSVDAESSAILLFAWRCAELNH